MHFQQPEYKTLNIGFLELDQIFMKTSQSSLEFPNESDENVLLTRRTYLKPKEKKIVNT